jgi:hypothetical protein
MLARGATLVSRGVVDVTQDVEELDVGRDAVDLGDSVAHLVREEDACLLLVVPDVEIPRAAPVVSDGEALGAQARQALEGASGALGDLGEGSTV